MQRVYDEVDPSDPPRVLADRLWPRGLRKDDPRIGQWHPEVAPSNDLRRWYGHEPERFAEFQERYRTELEQLGSELDRIRALGPVTLVTATKDLTESHLPTLADVLGESADLDRLLRWIAAGGSWASVDGATTTVSLLRCDGGEEADRFTSGDPALHAWLADHTPES